MSEIAHSPPSEKGQIGPSRSDDGTVSVQAPARIREDMGVIGAGFGGRRVVAVGLWVVVLFGAGEGVCMSWSPRFSRSVSGPLDLF